MSVTNVIEVWEGREATQDQKGVRRYTRVFKVFTDSATADALEVTADLRIPRRWSYYTSPNGAADIGSIARDYDVRQDAENPFLWWVKVLYSNDRVSAQRVSENPHKEPNQNETNPTLRPPDIAWGMTKFQRPIEKDLDGKPFVTPTGERYLNPLVKDDSRLTLTITRFESSYNANLAMNFHDTVNDGNITIAGQPFPAGTLKCDSITGQSVQEMGVYCYRVTYNLHYRREGWKPSFLDVGTKVVFADGTKKTIVDKNGIPVTNPVPVRATGNGPEVVEVDLGAQNPNYSYSTFRIYDTNDFSQLQLPR